MKKIHVFSLAVLVCFLAVSINAQNRNPSKKFDEVKSKTIYSKVLKENRDIYIYLPDNSSQKKFPVLFLIDGHSERLYKEALKYSKKNPHIIIGIRNFENRNRDLLPVELKSRPGSGNGKTFLKFITKELVPFVKTNYPSNSKNILFGGSNGGLFVIYAMLEKPEYFSAIISSSPMIGHCRDFMENKLKNFNKFEILKNKHLYIIYGMQDHYKQATEFIPAYNKKLKKKFDKIISLKFNRLEKKGHVPAGSITAGLNFIYQTNETLEP